MKKILLTILLSLSLTSCTTTVASYNDVVPAPRVSLYYEGYPVDYFDGNYYYLCNYKWVLISNLYVHKIYRGNVHHFKYYKPRKSYWHNSPPMKPNPPSVPDRRPNPLITPKPNRPPVGTPPNNRRKEPNTHMGNKGGRPGNQSGNRRFGR